MTGSLIHVATTLCHGVQTQRQVDKEDKEKAFAAANNNNNNIVLVLVLVLVHPLQALEAHQSKDQFALKVVQCRKEPFEILGAFGGLN